MRSPDTIPIPLSELNDNFHLEGGQLIRTRLDRITRGNQVKMVVDGESFQFLNHRLVYALKNQVSQFGYLVLDDDREYVAISKTIFKLLADKAKHIKLIGWSKESPDHKQTWQVDITIEKGVRTHKTFDSRIKALAYADKEMRKVWGEEFKRLNIYKTYFQES